LKAAENKEGKKRTAFDSTRAAGVTSETKKGGTPRQGRVEHTRAGWGRGARRRSGAKDGRFAIKREGMIRANKRTRQNETNRSVPAGKAGKKEAVSHERGCSLLQWKTARP